MPCLLIRSLLFVQIKWTVHVLAAVVNLCTICETHYSWLTRSSHFLLYAFVPLDVIFLLRMPPENLCVLLIDAFIASTCRV